jgi:hypothetical protein
MDKSHWVAIVAMTLLGMLYIWLYRIKDDPAAFETALSAWAVVYSGTCCGRTICSDP